MNAGILIEDLFKEAAQFVVSMAESFVGETFKFIADNAASVKSGQAIGVDIPILSDLASPAHVLPVSCLALSVIATLTYDLENADSSQKLSDVLSADVSRNSAIHSESKKSNPAG